MDEMQICTIRDLMQKNGCQTLKEFGEYLALSQSMDEMEKAENEYKAALAELKAALENEKTAEQTQELTNALQELNDALVDEPLPEDPVEILAQAALESDNPSAIVTDTISFLTDMVDAVCGLHSLREWLADDAPEDPVQEQHIRDITADIREMLTQLTDDAEMRACIGADTADAGARELREALQRLERREEEQTADN